MLSDAGKQLIRNVSSVSEEDGVHVQRVFSLFDARNKETGIERAIANALDAAHDRSARFFDIFVHHAEPLINEEWTRRRIETYYTAAPTDLPRHLRAYRSRLEDVFRVASRPIVILSPAVHAVPPSLQSLFPPEKSDRSCVSLGTTGFLPEDQFKRLLYLMDGIHPHDAIRLHGGYAGACVDQLALQLVGARLFHQYHIAPFADESAHVKPSDDEAGAMRAAYFFFRIFERARVCYGTVFDLYNARSESSIREELSLMTTEGISRIFPEEESICTNESTGDLPPVIR